MSESASSRLAADAARMGQAAVRPMVLAPNRLARFYSGGARIEELRGHPSNASSGPEDWVGSTTTSFGDRGEGLSRLAGGRVLREAIGCDPIAFLGVDHVQRWDANPGQSFAIIVVVDGWLTLWSERGDRLELARGATALVSHAAGATTFEGHATVIGCLPPAAEAEVGEW